MNAVKPNSYHLMLDVCDEEDLLKQIYTGNTLVEHDTSWLLSELKAALSKKHPETFWVKADINKQNGTESFHYTDVVYTRNPRIDFYSDLIAEGVISLDYTMHLKEGGKVRDHGYLFKIHPSNIASLFPEPVSYSLAIEN